MFQHFLATKKPFRKLGGSFMEVIETLDALMGYLVESREGIDFTGHIANKVERDLEANRTLRARFALMASIVKISISVTR